MNNLYFACGDCKIYIDAGYRWAYWHLEEPSVIERGRAVDVEKVLAAKTYWNPPESQDSGRLRNGVLPAVREFLEVHRGHEVVFGEEEEFAPIQSDTYFDWMQVGYLLMPTPRYFVEVLGFRSWGQVREYMEKLEIKPAWWEVTWDGDPSPHARGKQKFEELVK